MTKKLPRYWRESNFPRPRSPRYSDEVSTEIMQCLEGLALKYREDPEKLSTVLAAFARMGFPPMNWDMGMAYGGAFFDPGIESVESWSAEKCLAVGQAAMRGRRRVVLTARADGLLTGLEAYAKAILTERLHRVRLDAHIIDCRELSINERIERLRVNRGVAHA